MALPTSVESAYSNVRRAADALSEKNRELETARSSGDENRITSAQNAFKTAASELETRAKSLADAARRV